MQLILAEKPKVAQKIAMAIGNNIKRKVIGGVSYYEGTHNGIEIVVAPTVGHIYSLTEKKKTIVYPVFDIEWRPAYQVSKEAAYTKPYLDLLSSLGKKADSFVSACDYDLEGSVIAHNIFRFAVGEKEAHRMKFSTLTPRELAQAYENMGDFDYLNAYAGETRHILDWYYGINLSRALMSALRRAERYKVLSIGRVQGPTLGILSQLELKIKDFTPEPYWELTIIVKDTTFLHKHGRFLDKEEAAVALKRTGQEGRVARIVGEEFSVWPYPPFDLTSLQTEAYRHFSFSPSKTLEIAQSLYENSLISYPRTASQKLPYTLNLPGIIKRLAENPEYAKDAFMLIKNGQFKPFQGKKEDPAHPAIHPTGVGGKMNEQEKKLYDLIVRRFLAAFAPPAWKRRTDVEIDSNGELYAARGIETLEPGWTVIYGKYYKAEEKPLPQFKEGEIVVIEKKKQIEKKTKPPQRYSIASIVAELESRKIGTKATRSEIVETLYKRGYISGRVITVSDFGLKVHEVLQKYAPEILDEELTRKIEEDMEKIQSGQLDKEYVVAEGREILIQILDKWKNNEERIGRELLEALKITEEKELTVGKCIKCGGDLRIIRLKNRKQFVGCSNYPKCDSTYPLPSAAYVSPTGKVCEHCRTPIVNVRMHKKRFTMCLDPNCPTKEKWKRKGEADEKNR